MNGLRSMRLVVLLAATAILVSGCAVVKDSAKDAYKDLAKWQMQAKSKTSDPDYPKVQSEVNVWIEAKAKEVELAAAELFSQVEVAPDAVRTDVTTFLGPPGPAAMGIVPDLFDWILNAYKEGRKAEGAAVSTQLRTYKWPDK